MAMIEVADGVELFHTDHGPNHGQSPPVVMVHGWTCDGSDWSWLASDLQADHRVVVADLRGHGRSTPTIDSFDMATLAADVATLVKELGVGPAIVVGHSMGTVVASVLAVEHPELVSALVLVDPKYGIPDDRAEGLCAGMDADMATTTQAIFDMFYVPDSPSWQRFWHFRRMTSMPEAHVAAMFHAIFGPGNLGRRSVAEAYLGRRSCPVLAVYSELFDEAAEWERSLPHGPHDEVVVCTGGHFLHQEHPAEFAALVRSWLGRRSVSE